MPVIKLFSICVLWVRKIQVRDLYNNLEVVKGIGKWSMIDVFIMAYILFLWAAAKFWGAFEYDMGLWFMIAYLVCNYVLDIFVDEWVGRLIKIKEDELVRLSEFEVARKTDPLIEV